MDTLINLALFCGFVGVSAFVIERVRGPRVDPITMILENLNSYQVRFNSLQASFEWLRKQIPNKREKIEILDSLALMDNHYETVRKHLHDLELNFLALNRDIFSRLHDMEEKISNLRQIHFHQTIPDKRKSISELEKEFRKRDEQKRSLTEGKETP